jgi:hypothetical protein
MEIEIGGKGSKAKGLGLAAIALAIALALLDFVVLRGDRVDHASARLAGDEPAVLEIEQPGQKHLIEITTRRRRSGETKGRSIDYRLEDPDGSILLEDSELVSRKKRYLSFEPEVAGEYRLYVEDQALLGSSSGSASIDVYVNDRRILRRFSF